MSNGLFHCQVLIYHYICILFFNEQLRIINRNATLLNRHSKKDEYVQSGLHTDQKSN